jgi:hypothetical protein
MTYILTFMLFFHGGISRQPHCSPIRTTMGSAHYGLQTAKQPMPMRYGR